MPDETYSEIWENVWAQVKSYENIDTQQVDAFFSCLQVQAFSQGYLMLTADSDFKRQWVESHYKQVIEQALEDIYHVPFHITIETDPTQTTQITPQPLPPQINHQETPPVSGQHISPNQTTALQKETSYEEEVDVSLISEYSFDNFVVGTSNQLAYSMALNVAETPGEDQLNPLFIYSKSGLGKTHLLRAIQTYVSHNYPQMKTVYVDTMEFVDDYIDVARQKSGYGNLKQRYMAADILLIDDVQGLQGKEGALDMIFQILNPMVDRGKQIVLSADRAPKHIDIDERYRSRFLRGGTCDIQPPEVETKVGIIRNYITECKKKGSSDFEITPEVQEYVAANSSSNIRELKSAITKIIFHLHNSNQTTLTPNDAALLLKDHFSGGNLKQLTISNIQKAVEQYFGVSHTELVGKKRSANIVHARQVAIYLCRTMVDTSFKSIGNEFNRDHTTVMYSFNTIDEKIKESRELNEELEIIRQMIMEQSD